MPHRTYQFEYQYQNQYQRSPHSSALAPHSTMTRNQRFEPQVAHPQAATLKKQQERAMREAYRREKKIESYLADDENFPSFAIELKKLGLQLRDIPADGNCLFRALGDQLEGHSRNHYHHRQEVVKYMTDHRKDFEPFVEDDVPFEDHINSLKKLGTHAGNDVIVAFAKLHNVNVMIHQLNGRPLLIQGPSSSASVRQLHIGYHNGDHYSSIRRDGDNTESPANIRLQDDAKVAVTPAAPVLAYGGGSSGVVTAKRGLDHLESEVMTATGCQDLEQVRETLQDCDYDVDATIATLLQTLELSDGTQVVDDSTSVTSHQTTDSGIWAANGSASRIFGGGMTSSGSVNGKDGKGPKVHFREDSYGGSSGYSSLGSNRGGGARPKLIIPVAHTQCQAHTQCHVPTGGKAKEVKKMQKKRRAAEERHRQRYGIDPHRQLQHQIEQEDMLVIKQDVTRI